MLRRVENEFDPVEREDVVYGENQSDEISDEERNQGYLIVQ